MTAPMAVRLDWGKLHLGQPTGQGYRMICGRTLTAATGDLVVYWGRDVPRVWKLETVCLDCQRRVDAAYKRRGR